MKLFRRPKRVEACEVCGRRLKASVIVEITETFTDAHGGSSLSAFFCRTHAPRSDNAT